MKRDFLEGLGLSAEAVDKVMAENGRDVEAVKAKYADYDDVRAQLENANATLEKFKDYDQTKAEVEKFKAELKKSQEESAARIAAMERSSKVGEFLSGKKFANRITQDAVKARLADALADGRNAGKSLDDLFGEMLAEDKDILADDNRPTPPVVPPLTGGDPPAKDGAAMAREVMGLPPLK